MSIRNYWNEWGGMIHFWSRAFQPHIPQPCPPHASMQLLWHMVVILFRPLTNKKSIFSLQHPHAAWCGRASERHCSGRVAAGRSGAARRPPHRPRFCAPSSHITQFRWRPSLSNTSGTETQEYKTGNFIVTRLTSKFGQHFLLKLMSNKGICSS